ncbi:myosin heavy chain, embryonic smooth muscle isoform isoform X2 [Folsomia candida]|uniref:myosin heavy chain, embryonic smooth muscle isoform isoform X2 n=1 Tax=Folsomia candida TaxID=158441 RepID=UPI000B8F476C|nr:myosin heavy chain, embryonic smooth muscle isoform isoform X2 [Folsomia candida]
MEECLKTLQQVAKTTDLDADWFTGFVQHWRQLKEAERKAMVQLDAIRSKLISKETELTLLQADINMLAVDRDNKSMDVQTLTGQLNMLQAENDLVLKRIHELEEQLEDLKSKNGQLSDELLKKSEQLHSRQTHDLTSHHHQCDELTKKISQLQDTISSLSRQNTDLAKGQDVSRREKESQIKALQDALEDALEAKIKLQTKYEKELQDLQQSNSSLLDDFEWKLHQVESTARKKLLEKEKELQDQITTLKATSSQTFTAEKQELDAEREKLRLELRKVEHLKSYEAEVTQLRGVTNEQQKSIRSAARQLEQFKTNERFMQSEIISLKLLLEKEKSHCQVITSSTQRRLDAQEQTGLDQLLKQKAELNAKWEDKLKQECSRVQQELKTLHAEETRLAVESMKGRKDEEFTIANETWSRTRQDLIKEITKLKDEIKTNENAHQKAISKATTTIDRDNWELRHKMDKMLNEHLDEIDTIKGAHSEEMDRLRKRYDNALVQLDKLEKKIEDYERAAALSANLTPGSSSLLEKNDSGIATTSNKSSILDHTGNGDEDSDCSSSEEQSDDEEDEEEEEEEEDDEEEFEQAKSNHINISENKILELREEVATLQDSIDTLTLNLVQNDDDDKPNNNKDDKGDLNAKGTPILVKDSDFLTITEEATGDNSSSSFKSTTENESSSAISDTDNESDDLSSSSPFFLIGGVVVMIPVLSYIIFHSILIVLWTYFLLILLVRTLRRRRRQQQPPPPAPRRGEAKTE